MLSVQKDTGPSSFRRLTKDVIPIHYDLSFNLKWTTFVYQCTERINVKVSKPTKEILLHAVNFQIKQCEYQDEAAHINGCTEAIVDNENETIKFVFEKEIVPGEGTLLINFTGEVSEASKGGQKGLYNSKYAGKDGQDKFNYLTFFAPVSARFCFPCFDEPNFKSTFSLSLTLPKDLTGLSNMPILEEKPFEDDEFKILKFDKSPIMSTYIFAFAAGEFDFVEGISSSGVKCRVYTPPEKKHLGTFALQVAMKSLSFYEEYFNIKYPLPKLDLVAISDFPCGAMENWGLVTFRETCILVDDLKTTTHNKQRVALIVAHELAHQWFGNLVTMEWWTDLWLNEGFAEFAAFLCISNLFKEYDVWDQFVNMILNRALKADCLSSSHPIEIPVKSPSEIDEIFDDISYNKGASVIRMLYRYIGDEDFRRGMNLYLTRFQYSNARTSDLWLALDEVASEPIADMMSSWTKQKGYPILSGKIQDSEDGSVLLKFKVEKFTLLSGIDKNLGSYKWSVPFMTPICGPGVNCPVEKKLVDTEIGMGLEQGNESKNKDKWVKLNPDSVGFYRVDYPSEILKAFSPAIQSKQLSALDRLGVLEDLFAVVKSGRKSTVEILELLLAFVDEDHYTVWTTIANILLDVDQLLFDSTCSEQFRKFALRLLKPIGNKVGWEQRNDETHLQILLRPLILKLLVHFEDPETLKEARKRYHDHVAQKYTIPADFRQIVFTAALMEANEESFKSSLEHYCSTDLAEEKLRILVALTSMKNLDLIHNFLEFSLTDAVKSQDSAYALIYLADKKQGRDLAWEFFKKNQELFATRFPGGFTICDLVKAVTENFTSEAKEIEIEAFFRDHSFRGVERSVQQSIEVIRINRAWLQKDEAAIVEYLQSAFANTN